MDKEVKISVDSKNLDEAMSKVNRLAELLREVQQIISSLSGTNKSES